MSPQENLSTKVYSVVSGNLIAIFEDCLGCKWTLQILMQVRSGVNRPGALVRSQQGLTTKVLNERLARLVQFGILKKVSYPEIPPRVEYSLTDFGQEFIEVLDQVEALHQKFSCR